MRLLKLVLHEYKRIRLNLIKTLTYEPSAPVQFIIGTNGAGKSSLFHECSPLVPDKDDYEKGGYKHSTWDLEGAVYELQSNFLLEGGQHHSFKRDGVELNTGGTVTVQSELIKRHFRYSAEIHALITGETKFTSMRPNERKYWFTLLANESYDYGVSVFKRVTERYNEHKGALKRTKERFVIESAKLLPAAQLEQLRNDVSDLYVRTQRLIEVRQPLIDPSETYISKSNQVAGTLNEIATEVRQLIKRLRATARHPNDLQMLRDMIATEKQKLLGLQQQDNQYFEEYERMRRLLEAMQASHLENAAQIQTEISLCEATVEESKKSLRLNLTQVSDASTTIASCDKLLAWWPNVKANLHDNREKNWGRAMFDALKQEIFELSQNLEKSKALLAKAEQTIDHHLHHSEEANVECPKCHTKFQPNFSPLVLEDAKRRQREMGDIVKDFQTKLDDLVEQRDKIQEYFTNYTSVVQQVRNAPGMETFLDWMSKENVLLHTPQLFSVYVQQFREDAGLWQKIEQAQARIVQARELAMQLQARELASGGQGVQAERDRLERLVSEGEIAKQTCQANVVSLTNQLQLLESITVREARLRLGLEKLDALHLQAADSARREVFAQIIRELQGQLAFKEQALMAAERQESVIESIREEIETLTLSTADLKVLQQELSPTEGLIAEGIFGFMRTFVEQMNQTVEQLFSYPLKIQPCSTESGESVHLNYKFPIIVDREPRSDVSKGSSGMKEGINLAFVIAAMKSLGLSSYPLFLDEFGKTLDPVHKQAAIMLLTSIMELERFEQIFLISHDVVQYGSMGRSELVVLHEANVQLPPNCSFNTGVKME